MTDIISNDAFYKDRHDHQDDANHQFHYDDDNDDADKNDNHEDDDNDDKPWSIMTRRG